MGDFTTITRDKHTVVFSPTFCKANLSTEYTTAQYISLAKGILEEPSFNEYNNLSCAGKWAAEKALGAKIKAAFDSKGWEKPSDFRWWPGFGKNFACAIGITWFHPLPARIDLSDSSLFEEKVRISSQTINNIISAAKLARASNPPSTPIPKFNVTSVVFMKVNTDPRGSNTPVALLNPSMQGIDVTINGMGENLPLDIKSNNTGKPHIKLQFTQNGNAVSDFTVSRWPFYLKDKLKDKLNDKAFSANFNVGDKASGKYMCQIILVTDTGEAPIGSFDISVQTTPPAAAAASGGRPPARRLPSLPTDVGTSPVTKPAAAPAAPPAAEPAPPGAAVPAPAETTLAPATEKKPAPAEKPKAAEPAKKEETNPCDVNPEGCL